jgi:beta-mannosidase
VEIGVPRTGGSREMNDRMQLQWEIGWSDGADILPEKLVQAHVPGAVQLDWARAEGWGDPYYGDNFREYDWMEDKYWIYRTSVNITTLAEGSKLIFVSLGIDYSYTIRVNNEPVYRYEGMFAKTELDLTPYLCAMKNSGIVLEIVIDPVPKRIGAPLGRDQADHSCKPAVSYGWDWHPRLIPLGIWEETYIEFRSCVHLQDVALRYELSPNLQTAEVDLEVILSDTELGSSVSGHLEWKLVDPVGNPIVEQKFPIDSRTIRLKEVIQSPLLWWPWDHGDQPLYRSVITLFDESGELTDTRTSRVGFRRTRLVMHNGAWNEPAEFPKGRSHPPITLEINGRQLFAKGTNWVPPSVFPGTIGREDYRVLLHLAKDANMNLLRSWGGGIVNKSSFFELCDELGLMVWQEFPLACNLYPDDKDYMSVLDQEARAIVNRVRIHPSVVMWCGGNELFNAWSGMTEQSMPLRLLNSICMELDPLTPFMMSSPLDGMAHGNYLFRYWDGRDVFQVMPQASNTAYTEFGVPGPASVHKLESFIPPEELFPPREGTAWETHHAFNAWVGETWLCLPIIEAYFGKSNALEQLVERGQWLQCEGYKCIYEEARRQKPKCSMALNWCYNEPWPAAANNSLISWPADPKPSYYAVQSANRPMMASARIPRFLWQEDEWFEPELWLLNDTYDSAESGQIVAYLRSGSETFLLLTWNYASLRPNENQRGPTARFKLPRLQDGSFTLAIEVKNRPEWNSEYRLLFRKADNTVATSVMLNVGGRLQ